MTRTELLETIANGENSGVEFKRDDLRRVAVVTVTQGAAKPYVVRHRDWTRHEEVEIVSYADRLEVLSPGALPNGMTVKKMRMGQRSARNSLIAGVLRDYGYVDARGMGVRNKIIPSMRAQNGVDPEFEATEDYLRLTLPRGARAAS